MVYRAGRHFLQIPGPTNVPDRVLRAIDSPTIDHRGPDFAQLGLEVLEGMSASSGPAAGGHLSRVRHRRVGSGAGQHALAGRQGADVRDRPFRVAVAGWRRSSAWRSSSCPGDWRHGADRARSRRALAADKARDQGRVRGPQRDLHRRHEPHPAIRKAIDRPPTALLMVDTISSLLSIDYRHDEWGVDVTVGGSQKGLMLPPGLSFNAVSARRSPRRRREAAALLLGLDDKASPPTRTATALHAGHQPALRPARGARDAPRRKARERLRAP